MNQDHDCEQTSQEIRRIGDIIPNVLAQYLASEDTPENHTNETQQCGDLIAMVYESY